MGGLIKLGRKKEYNYPASIKEVDELSGEMFELFIFKYLKEFCGYSGSLTEKNDYGVDIILWKNDVPNIRYGAQCKRYGPRTILGENDLMKMQKGISHYGITQNNNGKANLILFTSAEEEQISGRGRAYIENEEIEAYYREDIIDIIKDLDEKLDRSPNKSNYSNIAFESSKKNSESFRENTKFVDMLKAERKNIAKYNKISPLFNVFNNKTLNEIATIKPKNTEELSKIYGIGPVKIRLWGDYLIKEINTFLEQNK